MGIFKTLDIQTGERVGAAILQGHAFTADGQPLAKQFFAKVGQPSMVAGDGPLSGYWPRKPAFHTCQDAYKAHEVKPGQSGVVIDHWTERAWRGQMCPACFYDRVLRIGQQVEQETDQGGLGAYRWLVIPAGLFPSFCTAARNHRAGRNTDKKPVDVRYTALPQFDTYFIIHNDPYLDPARFTTKERPAGAVPGDRGELFALIAEYADTYEERRLSHSNGWGGSWAGTKGDNRPVDEFDNLKEKAAQAAENEGRGEMPNGRNLYGMNRQRLLVYLKELTGCDYAKMGKRVFIDVSFDDVLEAAQVIGDNYRTTGDEKYTDKGQIESNGYMSLIRVDESPEEGQEGDKSGPEPAVQPILLAGFGYEGVRHVR